MNNSKYNCERRVSCSKETFFGQKNTLNWSDGTINCIYIHISFYLVNVNQIEDQFIPFKNQISNIGQLRHFHCKTQVTPPKKVQFIRTINLP